MNKRLKALKAALAEDIAKREKIKLCSASPTYPLRDAMPVEEARKKVASDFDELIREAEEWWLRHPPIEDDNPFLRYAREIMDDEEPPPVHAQRSPTGVGKTRVGAKEIAADRQRRQLIQDRSPLATRPWGYFGPTHRLNESTAAQFEEAGLAAQVYYGRGAWDRGIPGNEDLPEDERTLMCLRPERVAMAIAAHQSVQETCCIKRKKGEECEHFHRCGYQQQFGGVPDVWLAPHELLFHDPHALRELAGVIIDESFWSKGVYGVDERHWQIALDEMISQTSDMLKLALEGTLQRHSLVELLREHPLGGLQRERVVEAGITPEDCSDAIREEWKIVNRVKMSPEMTEEQVEEVKQLLPECRRARRMANVFRTLRELLESDIKVSGRLVLARRDGKTVLKVRGVKSIVDARNVPTMALDATLPDISILEKFHPQVRIVSDVEVKMPYVRVRQVLGAPVSDRKLWGTKKEREQNPHTGESNRRAVRRYILQRWLEIDGHQRWLESGRQPMVVICQLGLQEWLEKSGLPEGIALEHFNAIAGLDDHKDVRSLILVGRTIPPPVEVEAYAGALTGAEPLSEAQTGRWYGRVPRGIRMADGSGIEVERCDQHRDPVAEAVRRQICEAELIQALGRGRGVNRTAETPLDVDLLADVVLPVTVDEVLPWAEPSEAVEMMATEGVALTSPRDMAEVWPGIWETPEAARWMLRRFKTSARRGSKGASGVSPIDKILSIGQTPLAKVIYRRAAAGAHNAEAFFDLRQWPSPRKWFDEKRKALVALFHILRRHEIEPLAGAGGLAINAAVVRPAVERESLDALFNRDIRQRRQLREALYATAKPTSPWIGSSRTGVGARITYCSARATQEFFRSPCDASLVE